MDILRKRWLNAGNDHWLIAEVDARGVPGGRADRCLVCQNEQVVRRLWDFPADWYALSDVALLALCDGQLADMPRRPAADENRIQRPSAPKFEAEMRT